MNNASEYLVKKTLPRETFQARVVGFKGVPRTVILNSTLAANFEVSQDRLRMQMETHIFDARIRKNGKIYVQVLLTMSQNDPQGHAIKVNPTLKDSFN